MLLGVTLGGITLCSLLAMPFLSALVWALALSVLVAPFHQWLEAKLRRPNLAALLCVVLIGLVALGAATFVAQRLVQEATKGVELIGAKVDSGEWRRALAPYPWAAPVVGWLEAQDLAGTTKAAAGWLTTTGASLLTGSLREGLGLVVTFYLLFFFLRDRHAGLRRLRSLSPLTRPEMDRLCGRVGDTIHATIYGTLAVAAVQGLLGGLMFWVLGLPAPLFWGVVMALLAVVPLLGAFVIWIPAALFLAMEGEWGKSVVLAIWGGVVVSTIDNLLRPHLVGERLKLHSVLAFISAVGGIVVFGTAGLVLGPLILTIMIELLALWGERVEVEEASAWAPGGRPPE